MAYIIINPDTKTSNKNKSIEIHTYSKKTQKNNKILRILLVLSIIFNILQLIIKF